MPGLGVPLAQAPASFLFSGLCLPVCRGWVFSEVSLRWRGFPSGPQNFIEHLLPFYCQPLAKQALRAEIQLKGPYRPFYQQLYSSQTAELATFLQPLA